MSESKELKIIYELMNTISLGRDVESKSRYFGTDTPLYKADIHLISAIARNPGIHVIGLAEHLNITKGAVSKLVRKLSSKGFIKHVIDPDNRSRYLLYVTEKGETAHKAHKKFHSIINEQILEQIAKYSEDEKDMLLDFFKTVQNDLKDLSDRF